MIANGTLIRVERSEDVSDLLAKLQSITEVIKREPMAFSKARNVKRNAIYIKYVSFFIYDTTSVAEIPPPPHSFCLGEIEPRFPLSSLLPASIKFSAIGISANADRKELL